MRISTVSAGILLVGSLYAGHAVVRGEEPAASASQEWTVETLDGAPDLAAVWASQEGEIWVAGPKSVVRHKAGAAWLPADRLPAPLDWVDVHGTGVKDVWAVGSAAGLIHWDGKRWSAIPGFDGDAYVAIAATPSITAAINEDSVGVGDTKGWIYASGEGRPKGLRGLAVLDDGRFLAVGAAGLAIRIDGKGSNGNATPTWTPEKTGVATDKALNAAAACPDGEAVAVGASAVRRSAPGKWTLLPAPPVEVRGAAVRCQGKKLERVAAVAGDEVLILDVAKKTWSRHAVKAGATLTDIAPLGTGLVVVGDGGLVATSANW